MKVLIVRREDEATFGTYRTRDYDAGVYECAGCGGYGDEGGGVDDSLT
jgi:hypothetical protein